MPAARVHALWDRGAFAASPEELLQAGAAVTGTASEVAILFEERRHVYDAQGRSDITYRLVYKILTEKGVGGWDALSVGWAPWFEERPTLRARVVTPEGRAFDLDPATIEHGGGSRGDSDIYTDRQYLRAPLPGLTVGAVVEYVIASVERSPMFPAGVAFSYRFGSFVPVHLSRLIVDAPDSLALRFSRQGPQAPQPNVKRSEGRTMRRFEGGPFDAVTDIPAYLPYDVPRTSTVGYTTGRSWADVAAAYLEISEPRLSTDGLTDIVARARKERGRLAKIRKLLAHLHEKVRYTGIEFGQSSIVPTDPEEVLARGFGDCKDKSLMLVSMLRAVGIEARLALVLAGFGADVDPELPGLGGLDHAIVHVPGSPDLWIDATARYTAVGAIPLAVQGRRALVVAPETRGLETVPRRPSKANRIVEVRTFELHESEPTRIKEVTTSYGTEAARYRSGYDGAKANDVRERLTDYIKNHYGTEKLLNVDWSDAQAVDEPFVLSLEVEGGTSAAVWDFGAYVTIGLSNVFDFLPEDLKAAPGEGEEAREEDYLIVRPYVYELETRIKVPPGYAADQIPEKKTWRFGDGSLSQETTKGDGVVVVKHFFDTGPPLLTPEKHRSYRQGLTELFESEAESVSLVQEGEAHLDSGRVRQALAAFRKLVAADPDNPRNHGRVARALIAAGLGDAARASIAKAVKRFPKDAELHRARGWILEHSLLGERFKSGFDFDAALKAYRQAEKLDPDNPVVLASIGILLERDKTGVQTFPAENLEEAAAAYRKLFDQENRTTDVNYLAVLLKAGRWSDVIEVAKKLPANSSTSGLMLAALAAQGGVDEAVQEAARTGLTDEERGESIRVAAAELMRLRRYALSARLFEEAAKDHQSPAALRMFAQQMRNLGEGKRKRPNRKTPGSAALGTLLSVFEIARGADIERMARFTAPPLTEEVRAEARHQKDDAKASFRRAFKHMVNRRQDLADVPIIVIQDLLSLAEPMTEGDDKTGYRVSFLVGDRRLPLYVVRHQGRYGTVALHGKFKILGEMAGRHLEAGRIKAARKWLDWAAQDSGGGASGDAVAGMPLLKVWSAGFPGSVDAIRAAVGTLLAFGKDPDPRAEALLRGCIDRPTGEVARLGCEVALYDYLMSKERFEEASALSGRWIEGFPDSQDALARHVTALFRLKDLRRARKVLDGRRRLKPDDHDVLRHAADLAVREKKYDKGIALLERITKDSGSLARDFNGLAWYQWARGGGLEKAERLARKAVEKSQRRSYASLHTLAAVLADRGKPEEALAVLHEAMVYRQGDEPRNPDWLVIGMIAEAYGLEDEALAVYGRMEAPKEEEPPFSSWEISRERLKKLKARKGKRRRR